MSQDNAQNAIPQNIIEPEIPHSPPPSYHSPANSPARRPSRSHRAPAPAGNETKHNVSDNICDIIKCVYIPQYEKAVLEHNSLFGGTDNEKELQCWCKRTAGEIVRLVKTKVDPFAEVTVGVFSTAKDFEVIKRQFMNYRHNVMKMNPHKYAKAEGMQKNVTMLSKDAQKMVDEILTLQSPSTGQNLFKVQNLESSDGHGWKELWNKLTDKEKNEWNEKAKDVDVDANQRVFAQALRQFITSLAQSGRVRAFKGLFIFATRDSEGDLTTQHVCHGTSARDFSCTWLAGLDPDQTYPHFIEKFIGPFEQWADKSLPFNGYLNSFTQDEDGFPKFPAVDLVHTSGEVFQADVAGNAVAIAGVDPQPAVNSAASATETALALAIPTNAAATQMIMSTNSSAESVLSLSSRPEGVATTLTVETPILVSVSATSADPVVPLSTPLGSGTLAVGSSSFPQSITTAATPASASPTPTMATGSSNKAPQSVSFSPSRPMAVVTATAVALAPMISLADGDVTAATVEEGHNEKCKVSKEVAGAPSKKKAKRVPNGQGPPAPGRRSAQERHQVNHDGQLQMLTERGVTNSGAKPGWEYVVVPVSPPQTSSTDEPESTTCLLLSYKEWIFLLKNQAQSIHSGGGIEVDYTNASY
ncbi:hypothetical protein GYMLUDRAFT_246559 [Collybiopsis luxurians FD-317 M1]|uniref:Uncharacterized protein n=1 Tax=Collybiopsis luxurians FD-317 M1 TaxID=944289 RepID=A0A0D0CHY5_9AGAR|nr:hypothetical protein GYMLUDRAFT_246559 [Collybiopsis luxurians FD-317 M1]